MNYNDESDYLLTVYLDDDEAAALAFVARVYLSEHPPQPDDLFAPALHRAVAWLTYELARREKHRAAKDAAKASGNVVELRRRPTGDPA